MQIFGLMGVCFSTDKLQSINRILIILHTFKTLTKAPRPKYFDSFNNFISKQKLQQAFKSWSNFSLVLFGKGQEKHRTNFDKTHVTTLTNPCINFGKSM